MNEKTIKKFAKDIHKIIPVAEELLYKATVEERRQMRELAGGFMFQFSSLTNALSSETSRRMYLKNVEAMRTAVKLHFEGRKKPKR